MELLKRDFERSLEMAETKKAAKATTVKAEAVKAEPVKAAAKAEPKKAEVKAETVKTTEKKATKKATAAKKTTTTRCKKAKEAITVEFAGKSYTTEALVQIAKDVWKYDLNQKDADFKSVEIYVKPEESVAYYVINGDVTGSFAI